LACAVALAVTACGSSSVGGGSSAGAGGAGAASSNQIVIGDIGEYTGTFASGTGGFPAALNAWARYVNANGGIAGRQVKMVNMDVGTSTSAGASLTAAEQLITDDHAVAIIDLDSNDATWLPYATQQGVPVIGAVGQTAAPLLTADSFPITFSEPDFGYAFAKAAASLGPKFGVAYCAEASGCAQFATLFKAFGGALGVHIAVAAPLSASAPDYTAFCQELKDTDVNSYLLVLPAQTSAKITEQCYQQGVKATQLLFPYAINSSLKSQPAYDNSLIVDNMAAPFWDTSIPAVATMRTALAKYTSDVLGTQLDNSYLEYAWASGQLLAAAISNIKGDVTAASVKQGLYSLKGETLDGLTAPLSFAPAKPTSINCFYTWKVSNGQFVVPPGGSTPTCAPAALVNPVLSMITKSAGS
jgi:branched-chain amino acid transport system substrate-binding protein